jgi:hypothetical protein
MRRVFRLAVALATVSAAFGAAASGSFASGHGWSSGSSSIATAVSPFTGSGIGPLPAAPSSQAGLEGGADLSDGITLAPGGAEAGFLKGDEMYNGSSTTTVVDFTLPSGVTVHTDPSCGGLGNPNNYCMEAGPGSPGCVPDSSDLVTVSGNEVDFRVACAPGQSFFWFADLDSLISTPGLYGTSAQFKVGVYKRAKGTNMWQIKLPGSFEVGAP